MTLAPLVQAYARLLACSRMNHRQTLELPCFRLVFASIIRFSFVFGVSRAYITDLVNLGVAVSVEAGPAALEAEVRAPLELAFESRELRDVCENDAEAKRQFGHSVAEMLRHRLADLDAAISPKDLLVGQPRPGTDAETMVIDLCEGHRLVFTANHPNNPTTPTGELDWTRVGRIRILRIESEHA